MTRWTAAYNGDGALLQSGVPKMVGSTPQPGLLLRGVVVRTYVFDSPESPYTVATNAPPEKQAVYCDVWCYGSVYRGHLPRVLVLQGPGAGLQEGRIWKPRAATLDVTGAPVDPDLATNPANLDGDHVLIGFIDHADNQPVILGGLPHPSSDIGHGDEALGHRMRLHEADGDPDFQKHHGSFYGVDTSGNFIVDLTRAHDGKYLGTGVEPAPSFTAPSGNPSGNYTVRLPQGAAVTLEIAGGATLRVEFKDGDAELQLGDGAMHAAIVEHLEEFWTTTVKPWLDAFRAQVAAHTHIYAFGPTLPATGGTPPVTATPLAPDWDGSINSSKLSLPDG